MRFLLIFFVFCYFVLSELFSSFFHFLNHLELFLLSELLFCNHRSIEFSLIVVKIQAQLSISVLCNNIRSQSFFEIIFIKFIVLFFFLFFFDFLFVFFFPFFSNFLCYFFNFFLILSSSFLGDLDLE